VLLLSDMKIITASILFLFVACNQGNQNNEKLRLRVDSLETEINNSYKPGLGEFMSQIQVHHAKLWFAGINNNWKLADFEIHEIGESLEDIQKFNTDRPEAKSVAMLQLPIDSITNDIATKNTEAFKKHFAVLTQTCNNCHHATAHEFNVVTIPSALPVTNQDFRGN
jgi:hypothetical protein